MSMIPMGADQMSSLEARVSALESKTALDGTGNFPTTTGNASATNPYYKINDIYFRPSDNTVRFASNGAWHKFTITNA